VPGVISEITKQLAASKVNILGQYLKTNDTVGYVVFDVDKNLSKEAFNVLKRVSSTIKTRMVY
jgi:D-3-phosphoglycerate dehydrogenase